MFAAACHATKSAARASAYRNSVPGEELFSWVLAGFVIAGLSFMLAGKLRVIGAGLTLRRARDGVYYKQNDAYCADNGMDEEE